MLENLRRRNGDIFFLSDFHLGSPDPHQSLIRERKIVHFLQSTCSQSRAVFLLGDIFDFWFEYKRVVPAGFTRLLGTLSSMSDAGIPVFYVLGNHDLWLGRYLEQECGVTIIATPLRTEIDGKTFFIAHGDGLGPKQVAYKILKKIFTNRPLQFLFRYAIHPDAAMAIGLRWSALSRKRHTRKNYAPTSIDMNKEYLVMFCEEMLMVEQFDYFIFGHRHIPNMHPLSAGAIYANTGDWITHFSYLRFSKEELTLEFYAP